MSPPSAADKTTPNHAAGFTEKSALRGAATGDGLSNPPSTADAQRVPPVAQAALGPALRKNVTQARDPLGSKRKLALGLTALFSGSPVAGAWSEGVASRQLGRTAKTPLRDASRGAAVWGAPSGSRLETLSALFGHTGPNDGGNGEEIEAFSDFDGSWIGDVPDSTSQDPNAFLAKFRAVETGEFIEGALRAHGCTQQVEQCLAQFRASETRQGPHLAKLDALVGACLDWVQMLCHPAVDQEKIPALSEIDLSQLAEVVEILQQPGLAQVRRHFLLNVNQIYMRNDALCTMDSISGKVLSHIAEPIVQEIKRAVIKEGMRFQNLRFPLKGAFSPLLHRLQKMHEMEAGLASLRGDHAAAAAILQNCIETVLTARMVVSPLSASGDTVLLTFELLKAKVSANDNDCVGTLEELYTRMLGFTTQYRKSFPPGLSGTRFLLELKIYYRDFLAEVKEGRVAVDLNHPIIQLFEKARDYGVFDADLRRNP
jgi:hypothetical protein